MIHASFYKKSDKIYGFKIFGHSGYDVFEKDIICAAVSTCVEMALNMLEECKDIKSSISIEEQEAVIDFRILSNVEKVNNICFFVLNGLQKELKIIEEQYGDFLKVEIEEVKDYD